MRKRNQPENHCANKKRPYTTTLKMNILSSLVLSCLLLSSLLLSCLCSSVFSSLFVSVSVRCFGVSAWCGVVCGAVCPLNTSPCVRSKRPRVYRHHAHTCGNTCARGAGTHGDVLNVHTVTFFISKTCVFYHVHEHLNRMLGSSLIDNFLLTMNGPYGLSRASEVHQRNP